MSIAHRISHVLKRHTTATYAVILFVAALVVRIPVATHHHSLGPDDGVYGMSALSVSRGLAPFRDTFSSQGGYFLELISVPVRIFPDLFMSPRIISILTGCAIAVCTFFISKRIMPETWAFVAGMLCAVSGTLLRTTGPITSDGVVALAALLCIITALRFVDSPTLARAIVAGSALGFGTQIKNVFMIPVIIFLIAITLKTPLVLRLTAGITSIAVFALPFFLYGPQHVWDQSFVYHMEKNDQQSISANAQKIVTTLSSFDMIYVALFVLVVIGSIATLFLFPEAVRGYARRFFHFPTSAHSRGEHTANYLTIFYFIPAVALMVIQTPLFRNHLAIIVPVGYIVLVYFFRKLCLRFLRQKTNVRVPLLVGLIPIAVLAAISSYIATINSSTFAPYKGNAQAQKLLEPLRSDAIVLTDDPGLVWAAGLHVPRLFTDVSRYRFSSQTPSIALTQESFSDQIGKDRVCAAVQSPIQNAKLLNIAHWVPSTWEKHHVGKYTLWIDPSQQCQ